MKKLIVFVIAYPAMALLALRTGAVIAGLPTIAAFFYQAHPVVVVSTLAAGFAALSYLLGAVTGDYSWVDRLWSTAPVAFAWVYAVRSGFAPAVTTATLLVTAWGLRLTYNFARRGGYTTMEDYRWPILRRRIRNSILWQLFNLGFICGYQILLFILFTLPVYRLASLTGPVSLAIVAVGVAAFLALLIYETIADQQQWEFQSIKHGDAEVSRARIPTWFGSSREEREEALRSDMERGFLTHGLFRLSRHPNYFGELGVWWVLYFFSCAAAGNWFHWSGLGALLLTLLFVGSTAFTESISAERYPRYVDYQSHTSAIIPWPPQRPVEQEQPY